MAECLRLKSILVLGLLLVCWGKQLQVSANADPDPSHHVLVEGIEVVKNVLTKIETVLKYALYVLLIFAIWYLWEWIKKIWEFLKKLWNWIKTFIKFLIACCFFRKKTFREKKRKSSNSFEGYSPGDSPPGDSQPEDSQRFRRFTRQTEDFPSGESPSEGPRRFTIRTEEQSENLRSRTLRAEDSQSEASRNTRSLSLSRQVLPRTSESTATDTQNVANGTENVASEVNRSASNGKAEIVEPRYEQTERRKTTEARSPALEVDPRQTPKSTLPGSVWYNGIKSPIGLLISEASKTPHISLVKGGTKYTGEILKSAKVGATEFTKSTAGAATLTETTNAFGKVALPVAVAVDAFRIGLSVKDDIDNKSLRNTVETTASVAGGWAGGAAGAASGAALGTMIFPGVGTFIGGAIGGISGSLGGSIGGKLAVEAIGDAVEYDMENKICENCGRQFKIKYYKGEKRTLYCLNCR